VKTANCKDWQKIDDLCVSMCKNVQTVGAIDVTERGFRTTVSTAFNKPLSEVPCVNCGQCINVCPVGALREKDDIDKVWEALANPELHVGQGCIGRRVWNAYRLKSDR